MKTFNLYEPWCGRRRRRRRASRAAGFRLGCLWLRSALAAWIAQEARCPGFGGPDRCHRGHGRSTGDSASCFDASEDVFKHRGGRRSAWARRRACAQPPAERSERLAGTPRRGGVRPSMWEGRVAPEHRGLGTAVWAPRTEHRGLGTADWDGGLPRAKLASDDSRAKIGVLPPCTACSRTQRGTGAKPCGGWR